MSKDIVVQMTPTEVAISKLWAERRFADSAGCQDKQMGKQDPHDIEEDGTLAELAFAKVYNLYPDLDTAPRKGGHDLITHQNMRVNVKATRYTTGRLAVHIDKRVEDCDIYVLAIVRGVVVTLVGWKSSAEVINKENIGTLGHGKCYLVKREDLEPMPVTSQYPR